MCALRGNHCSGTYNWIRPDVHGVSPFTVFGGAEDVQVPGKVWSCSESDSVLCQLEKQLIPLCPKSLGDLPLPLFSSDDLPKPQIITQPETTMAVVGKDIRFTCSAASSSSSPMTFAWKKDNEVLVNADMENFAHVRAQDGEVMEYTTILHLRRVTFGHEGRYQCVITNHFGSTYSHKARLTVNGRRCSLFNSGARFL